MLDKITVLARWFAAIWTDSEDVSTRDYRRHIRGLFTGWGVAALAIGLIGYFPNDAHLTMYQLLNTSGLPWQQHGLAALEVAGPLVMAWHLFLLHRWGRQSVSAR